MALQLKFIFIPRSQQLFLGSRPSSLFSAVLPRCRPPFLFSATARLFPLHPPPPTSRYLFPLLTWIITVTIILITILFCFLRGFRQLASVARPLPRWPPPVWIHLF